MTENPRRSDPHGHDHGHRHHHDHGHDHDHDHDHGHGHAHAHGEHGHSHGLIDPSITRSREGVRVVAISLGVLALTAVAQGVIFAVSDSVALLADLIHNVGDALTAVPLGVAFYLRSFRLEKVSGLIIVALIFFSACAALWQTIERFLHPQTPGNLWVLALAGVVGFLGNELAARIRLSGGRRLKSPALIADGEHARTDGVVSLGVVASAGLIALGLDIADPIIGLVITVVILKITWDSWRVISSAEPGEAVDTAASR